MGPLSVRGSQRSGAIRNPLADNEFTRLGLWPSNVVGPLELAVVYGMFLGDTQQAQHLADLGIEYATRKGTDVIPRIKDGLSGPPKSEQPLVRGPEASCPIMSRHLRSGSNGQPLQ